MAFRILLDDAELAVVRGSGTEKAWRETRLDLPGSAARLRIESLDDARPAQIPHPDRPFSAAVRLGELAIGEGR